MCRGAVKWGRWPTLGHPTAVLGRPVVRQGPSSPPLGHLRPSGPSYVHRAARGRSWDAVARLLIGVFLQDDRGRIPQPSSQDDLGRTPRASPTSS